MKLLFLCTQWGHEHLPPEDFFLKVKESGYDGVDTWLPDDINDRKKFIRLLDEYNLSIVSHQHQARGSSINEFCRSFEYYLQLSAECNPVLINSHSGRDYFTLDEQLQVLDTAHNFSVKNKIRVVHETHRGRIGFGPVNAKELFSHRPGMKITADFSHWVCVTESYLENFQEALAEAIVRAAHIHARVGFTQGPQVPDPRKSFWQNEVEFFLNIWERIINYQESKGVKIFTITPEFGPPPYMWTNINDNEPVANQWEINLFIKELLLERFSNKIKTN